MWGRVNIKGVGEREISAIEGNWIGEVNYEVYKQSTKY